MAVCPWSYTMRALNLLLVLILPLAACALLPDQVDETEGWSAQKLYSKAKDALDDGSYESAINYFEKLEARYPFGQYAQQALLETAYAYYKYDEPESATATLDRFIKTYPRNPHIDYAYYLKGLVNFDRTSTLLDRYLPRDPTERDAGAARDSFFDFQQLVQRFPDSKYAKDARLRMAYLRNNLAKYDVHVADYYMRRGAYIAAANRAKHVIEKYPRTPAVPEALKILIQAYQAMGLDELAADAKRVLELNFPAEAGKDGEPEHADS
jgi:outer membrane protein assembly factor BamD